MQITINVQAPELAQAIQALAASLSTAQQPRVPGPQTEQAQLPAPPVSAAPPVQQPVNQQAAPVAPPQVPTTAPTAVAPAPTASPAQQPAQQQAPSAPQAPTTAPTSAPTYDFNQLATATMQLQQAGHNIMEFFNAFGIGALNQLPKERYGEYAAYIRDRGAKL